MFSFILWLLLGLSTAQAQQVTCPTRALGDKTNACASTAFVNQFGTGSTTGSVTPNLPVIGNSGGTGFSQGTRSGNTTKFGTIYGPLTDGNCVSINNGNLIDAGVTCNGGSGSGSITAGTTEQFGYYPSDGTTIAGQSVAPAATMYVACTGNDSDNGLTPVFAKATIASAMTALGATGGTIHVGGNCTYNLTTALQFQPKVLVNCANGATISQANAEGLSELIDFNTNTASGAGMENCTIDGNVAGQSLACSGNMINIGAANDVYLRHNTFKNAVCTLLNVTSGLRPVVTDNVFSGWGYDGIGIYPTAAQTPTHGIFRDNVLNTPGGHFMEINGSDGNIVEGNQFVGTSITGIVATVSTNAVTWVSGPDFSTLRVGNFIICNGSAGYQELWITAINSSTSLTITPGVTLAGANQNCIAGPGDLIDVTNASFNNVGGNYFSGGATGGVVVNNYLYATYFETVQENHVHDNVMFGIGGGCLWIDGITGGGAIMDDNSFTNNQLNNCNMAGLANTFGPAGTSAAIVIDNENPTTSVNTFVSGNQISQTAGSTYYWMAIQGTAVIGEVSVGKNAWRGVVNQGIYKGFRSTPTLSAGWGSSASVTSYISNGTSFQIGITASGTGQAIAPTITIQKGAYGSGDPSQPVCSVNALTSGAVASVGITSSSISTDVLYLGGTPVAGQQYVVYCHE